MNGLHVVSHAHLTRSYQALRWPSSDQLPVFIGVYRSRLGLVGQCFWVLGALLWQPDACERSHESRAAAKTR